MIIYIYDGSFEGLMTVVFEVYARKAFPDRVMTQETYTPLLMEECHTIETDAAHAQRVMNGIKAKGSADIGHKIYNVYLSEDPNMEVLLLSYIRLVLEKGAAIEFDYRQPAILRVKEINKQIHREVHRMHAFVRFKKTTDNLYYATVAPDFNVLPLIGEHFEKRYADQHWMIYDTKRKYGLYYNQEEMILLECGHEDLAAVPEFAPGEPAYEYLWKNYFSSVNIVERKNLKLHLRHVPKRYWKYLPEKR